MSRRWWTLVAVSLATFMTYLDAWMSATRAGPNAPR